MLEMYAHITVGTVDAVQSELAPEILIPLGWLPVTEAARPSDTATTTWEPVFTPTGATVTQSWVEVPKSQEQLDADDREAARIAIRAIVTDLQTEKGRCDAVLAKTAAQITGGDTKDVARAAKRIADAAIDLARFLRD